MYFKENGLNWKPCKKKKNAERTEALSKFREWSGTNQQSKAAEKQQPVAEKPKAGKKADPEAKTAGETKVLLSGGRLEMRGKAQDICTKLFGVLGNKDVYDVQIDFKVTELVALTDWTT